MGKNKFQGIHLYMSCDERLISVELHADSLSIAICSAFVNICALLSSQDIGFRNKLFYTTFNAALSGAHHGEFTLPLYL